jgi:hypothetical protein
MGEEEYRFDIKQEQEEYQVYIKYVGAGRKTKAKKYVENKRR